MPKATINIIPDADKNFISFSKNYRIFQQLDPVSFASSIEFISEDIDLNGNSGSNLTRKLRYSTNKFDWSLWFDVNLSDLSNINAIILDSTKPVFIEMKYEYDNGGNGNLADNVVINSFKVRFITTAEQPTPDFAWTPNVACSDEKCAAVIAARLSEFQPYAAGAVIDLYRTLSFQTNVMFGHEVVYFRTLPDTASGDFIFREWTLFNSVDRKCIKILVPNNEFPDNKPKFNDFGVDFEIPFEVQIDDIYFASIFGKGAEPRVRDFLYFPLLNRMYEIKSSYLFRGFMMQGVFWKIQLVKYQIHTDTEHNESNLAVLQKLIVSSEDLFKTKVEEDVKDATNPQQFKTISQFKDETRDRLNRDLSTKQLNMTFNYSNLIEYYYDMTGILTPAQTYHFDTHTGADMTEITGTPKIINAYEGSDIYKSWRSGFLSTFDLSIPSSGPSRFIRTEGPFDSHGNGRYITIRGFRNTNFTNSNNREDVYITTDIDGNSTTILKGRDAAVVYQASGAMDKNLTITMLVKFNKNTNGTVILSGYDPIGAKGIKVTCTLLASPGNLVTVVSLNNNDYTFTAPSISYDVWYAMVIPISSQFGQIAFNLYGFTEDPANRKNWNSLGRIYNTATTIPTDSDFSIDNRWELKSGAYMLANLRIFNTMIQEEDHEFALTQLYLRDESMLTLVDNCKPRLNLPFVAINR